MNKLKITNMRNVYLSCAIMLISAAGVLHTYFGGGWSKSTGEAAKMFPRLIYVVLFVVALFILVKELIGRQAFEPAAIAVVKWWQIPVVLCIGAAFFLFTIYIGTGVGLLLYLVGMIAMFDEDPKKNWKLDLIVAVCASVVLWLIFTKVLPIMTLNRVLF